MARSKSQAPAKGKPAAKAKPLARKAKPSAKQARPSAKQAKPPARPAKPPAAPVARSSRGPAPAMLQKVAFTMLPVTDAARARAFYEDVLGLTRGLASPDGVWTEYDLPGGGCVALFRHPDPAHASAPGGGAVALEVADLDALNTRLVAAGVRYRGGIVHGPRCRMSNIVDSEGNGLILHQLAR